MPMSLFQIDITEIVIGCQDNKIEEMSIFMNSDYGMKFFIADSNLSSFPHNLTNSRNFC
jgi:hypothetical protein